MFAFILLFIFSFCVQADPVAGEDLFITQEGSTSDTGYLDLSWKNPERLTLSLERSASQDFATFTGLYYGRGSQLFVSGLQNGTYFFRLRNQESKTLDTLRITVKHHSLSYALLLFLLGGVSFLMVCLVIMRGER
jgi:hypothetical protein